MRNTLIGMHVNSSPIAEKNSCCTSVRRKSSFIEILLTGSKKILAKKIVIFIFGAFCINISNAQLTYTRLAVQYDSTWTCGKLQLIPVRFKDSSYGQPEFPKGSIISFEQALREGKISVKETNTPGGDDVGLLEVKNHSKKNILVNSGEIVAGGMQDRAFATTTIIPPSSDENYLPVFCIEKGRWGKKIKMRSFRYAGSVDAALRRQIDVTQKQNKVWKEIDKQLSDKGIQNLTGAYLDLYKDTSKIDTTCMNFFRRKMMESDSAYAGFVAVTGNRIINCELFGSSSLCIASFEVLLKGYMRSTGANEVQQKVSADDIKKFLDKFLKTEAEQQQYLSTHGRLYSNNGHTIHLIAYDD
ncbi:MAG: DUF6569 family protein [Panacibacter sp.]